MLQPSETPTTLLSERDPQPVETVNADGSSPFVLSCEHAGRVIPERLGDLGVGQADMDRHIAWDVGADGLSRRLSALLDAPLVLQRYSRLVVDCNRPIEAPDCFPEQSDSTPVPGNIRLTELERRRRFDEIHQPFHRELAQLLDRRVALQSPTILVAVHSFTPRLVGGPDRPWHLGALSNRDGSFTERFLAAFRARNRDVPSAHNEPYVVDDRTDYTIPVHGEARGIPHLLLEIRNDLIAAAEGQDIWAARLADALVAAKTEKREDTDG
ncbi:N-formylglutamate amidohydrolase [Mesorhizobium sp. BAC0120]|uniref:N-formylglutamate amidohydrolase n=1 Tax=Mesorhizobium sp. BAC0120 TaxID=3090670 RepID=UPI00298C7EC2|nr:N-formylglutamate amidohydrolase [Mesorhizobium sp. BAC0120]MDW6026135.1 N-formylglutamate amidohydrolase [Mesorhizobium sp. BAC0120]